MSFRLFVFFCIACFFQSLFIDRTKVCSCEELEEKDCSIDYVPYCSWINQTCVQVEPTFFNDALSCQNHYYCWTLDNKCEEITDCTRCNGTYCPTVCHKYKENKTDICVSPQVAIDKCPILINEISCDESYYCVWNEDEKKCVYDDHYLSCEDYAKNITCPMGCKDVNNTCQSISCEWSPYCSDILYNRTHSIPCNYQNKTCTKMEQFPQTYPDKNSSTCGDGRQSAKWSNNSCQQCSKLVTKRNLLLEYLLPKDWPPVGSTTIGNSSQSVNSSTNTNSTNQTTEGGQTDTSNQNSTTPQSTTQEGSLHSQSILVRSLVIIIIMFN